MRTEEQVLAELRDLYRKKQYPEMKRLFYRNIFFFDKETRAKLKIIVDKFDLNEKWNPDEAKQLVVFAEKELGCKIEP